MIRTPRRLVAMLAALVAAVSYALTASAEVDVSGGNYGVTLSNLPASMVSVRVSGPDGFFVETQSSVVGSEDGSRLADGVYRYEVVVSDWQPMSLRERDMIMRDNAASGRDASTAPSDMREIVAEQGSFRIYAGTVLIPSDEVEE